MAIAHAAPGEVVDILGPKGAAGEGTAAIFKTPQLEVIRMVLPQGKEVPAHRVPGELTVQCLQGSVAFTARGRTQALRAGQVLHLMGGDEHALRASEDSTLLVTIALS
jgi:quercetin dioxygenase-like cupin family protein